MSRGRGWAAWFTGLPGCGKSSAAGAVAQALRKRGMDVAYLAMDEKRKQYVPNPKYTEEERERAYAMFVDEAAFLVRGGKGVVVDATAHRRAWRDRARRVIPVFCEVQLRCSLETAMERESARPEGKVMADLYAKALERKRTGREVEGLGPVPGVDEPYEENPDAELVIDAENQDRREVRARALSFISLWLLDALS
ncbi:adenylyl-sulfate kinase [Desulfohalovibrio reitneri]|uniref:adenylyl-sulfate kinase n=1 Tax=Desulfohalovibrio reitneri TaxID=1307759 RepID=UPI0004A6BD78|nr:adenylyl-sulfate kinase [Desulfohalovibrio reitneri]